MSRNTNLTEELNPLTGQTITTVHGERTDGPGRYDKITIELNNGRTCTIITNAESDNSWVSIHWQDDNR